jgi:hypothetical protein
MALSVTAQARELRRLTGIPRRRALTIILAAAERKPRRTSLRQMTLEEQPATPAEIAAAFAKCRQILAQKS